MRGFRGSGGNGPTDFESGFISGLLFLLFLAISVAAIHKITEFLAGTDLVQWFHQPMLSPADLIMGVLPIFLVCVIIWTIIQLMRY